MQCSFVTQTLVLVLSYKLLGLSLHLLLMDGCMAFTICIVVYMPCKELFHLQGTYQTAQPGEGGTD